MSLRCREPGCDQRTHGAEQRCGQHRNRCRRCGRSLRQRHGHYTAWICRRCREAPRGWRARQAQTARTRMAQRRHDDAAALDFCKRLAYGTLLRTLDAVDGPGGPCCLPWYIGVP